MAVEHLYIFPTWGAGNDLANHKYITGLDLPLRNYEKSQLAITNIEGLAPVPSDVNITQYAAKDGGVFNSSRKPERHIVITMKLFNYPSMDSVREKIYKYCPGGQPIGLVFEFSDGYAKAINGYVEDTPADYFGEQEGIQISVACPDPELRPVTIHRPIDPHDPSTPRFSFVFKKGEIRLPSQTTILEPDADFNIDFYPKENEKVIMDPIKMSSTNGLISIDNEMKEDKKILYAVLCANREYGLKVNFYSEKPTIEEEVNQYIDATENDVYEENLYYHLQNDDKTGLDRTKGYKPIESELEFDYRTTSFNKLTQQKTFAPDKFYERSDSPEPGIWIPVTWQAEYSDEQDPTMYDYPVKYGFLNNNLVNNKIVNSICSQFDLEASYFSSAERMFFDLSKSGTPLPSARTFEHNTYYKLARTYELINGFGGWTPVLDEDPIYFFEDIEAYSYADGRFEIYLPLYGFYNIAIEYAVIGTTYVSGKFYYINENGEEILVTGGQPSDWASSMVNKKYYEKVPTFYNLLNYPGVNANSDSVMIGGRSRYDVILDYLTYKYDQIVEQMAYEPNVYYEFIGYAETELEGMYGLSIIPIYQLLTGDMPEDWGSSDKYFTRTKMTVLERPYPLYYNDHAYSTILNRAVFRYELLDDAPDDWDTGYSNYYTLETDYSNIIAYFTPDEYPNYSKLYSLLTEEPSDWSSDFSKYYEITKPMFAIYKKTEAELADVIVDDPSNIQATIDLKVNTFVLGDENGLSKSFEFRRESDVYSPNTYYTYNSETEMYELVTSTTIPEDWSTNPYRYYIKRNRNSFDINDLTIIFWNPVSWQLEYDIDQTEMFLNDFDSWSKNAMAAVYGSEVASTGNKVYYRNIIDEEKNIRFKTYALAENYVYNKQNILVPSSKKIYIFASTYKPSNVSSDFNYNPTIVVGISSYG